MNQLFRFFGVLLLILAPIHGKAQFSEKSRSQASEDDATPRPKKAAGTSATPSSKKKKSAEVSEKAGASTPRKKKPATPAEVAESTPKPAVVKKPRPPQEPALPGEEPQGLPEEPAPVTPMTSAPASTPSAKTYDRESAASDPAARSSRAPAATIEPGELTEFDAQPPRVQAIITAALELTKRNLTYAYGSADPSQGGMDCSGTMYYLLRAQGFQNVPRDSSGQYVWARKTGQFFAVVSTKAESFEFDDLLPGDLMFWTGTYQVTRDVPVSHVMLYLGKEKKSGKRVMFGASDGRSYNGIQRWGVSVFDFKMPKADTGSADKQRVDFIGYARIPALRNASDTSVASLNEPAPIPPPIEPEEAAAPKENVTSKPTATPTKQKTPARKSKSTPTPTPRKRSKPQ